LAGRGGDLKKKPYFLSVEAVVEEVMLEFSSHLETTWGKPGSKASTLQLAEECREPPVAEPHLRPSASSFLAKRDH
jgi:hypothetical protein